MAKMKAIVDYLKAVGEEGGLSCQAASQIGPNRG